MLEIVNGAAGVSDVKNARYRKSLQPLMPYQITDKKEEQQGYDIYPFHALDSNKIHNGYLSLAKWMAAYPCVIVDGYSGVLWQDVQTCLREAFLQAGINVHFIEAAGFLRP